MQTSFQIALFAVAAIVSVFTSGLLIGRLERVARRFGLTEALLGLMAALAADTPEITSSITALLHGQRDVGIGVTLGSNVFNLAALLGIGTLVAGRIHLHRRVILLEGVVAMWIGATTLAVVIGALAPWIGLVVALLPVVPYLSLSAATPAERWRVPLPPALRDWVAESISEEEMEIGPAIDPRRGGARDAYLALGAVLLVISANVVMVISATHLGTRFHISPIIVGGVALAAVTSLPNLVAAIFLGRQNRGSALLSEAMNSNSINSVAGLLVPATLIGLARPAGPDTLTAAVYGGLTLLVLGLAYFSTGLRRSHGILVIVAYGVFLAALASL